MAEVWERWTASGLYGLNAAAAPAHAHVDTSPGVAVAAGPGLLRDARAVWHPDHPLFWAVGLAGVVAGLIGVSTGGSVRLGKRRLSVSASAGA